MKPSPLLKLTLSTTALLLAAPLSAGWQQTQWNMTAEEVATAMGEQAPLHRGRRGERLGGKDIRNVGEYRTEDARFRTVYYYDGAGLSHVVLYRQSGSCEQIAARLQAEYGQPVRVSDQVLFRLIIWHDEAKQNRIRLMVSSSICDLNYERLSDYWDVDLANGQLR